MAAKRLLLAMLLAAIPVRCGHCGAAAEPARRLNVVFILADDLGWGEVGCFGQKKIPTPNIDRLAEQGTRLTRHYSGAPVCAPSRCVLMTGLHTGHAEIRGNQQARVVYPEFSEGQHPISPAALTFPMLFQKAGYATAAMGKWGLGPVGSSGEPNRKGFDLFFGYNCQSVAHSYFPPHLWRNGEKIPINARPIPGHARQPEGEVRIEHWQSERYAPKLMVEEAEKFIARSIDRPFLLYLPFIEPHVAMQPPPELVARFPEEWDPEVYRGENRYLPHPRPRAAYAAMIVDLDRHVGRVLDALKNGGIADRTLVVFTSDNGAVLESNANPNFHVGGADPKFFNSTAGLRGYKGSVYEGGIRVPTIVRLPGVVPAGGVNDSPSYFADWFPTLCEAVGGIEIPKGLDGESLWSAIVQGVKRPRQKPMIWVYSEGGGQVAVNRGDWKVVRRGVNQPTPGSWEAYDLEADPGETRNLAGDRPQLLRETIELLRREVANNPVFPVRIPGVSN